MKCANCHPPTNVKHWAMVVIDEAGERKFVHHPQELAKVGRLRIGEEEPEEQRGPTHSPLGIPMDSPDFELWWEENARYSEVILDAMEIEASRLEHRKAFAAAKKRLDDKRSRRPKKRAAKLL